MLTNYLSLFGQVTIDSICLSLITDTIKSQNKADKYIININNELITYGQEYCFPSKMIKSIHIYKIWVFGIYIQLIIVLIQF